MPDGLDLGILHNSAELESAEPAWRRLWQADPHATPFQHPAWLLPWTHQFGHTLLRTVTITQSGELIAFLPFYIYRDPHCETRRLLLLGAGTSDYLDGLFAPTCAPQHVQQALDMLEQSRQDSADWDTASITQLRPGSRLLEALGKFNSPCAAESCSRMPATPIAHLPRKIRQNIAYYRNRARRHGTLQFTVATASDCLPLFDALVRLHSHRWQTRGQSGVLSDPPVLACHREAIPLLARHGLLHLSALRHNDEIIAATYGLIDPPDRPNRTLYVYLPAFSPNHAAFSPGTLLLASVVEHAAKHGIHTIDMLRGDERYKELWHMEKTPTYAFELRSLASKVPTTQEQAA